MTLEVMHTAEYYETEMTCESVDTQFNINEGGVYHVCLQVLGSSTLSMLFSL